VTGKAVAVFADGRYGFTAELWLYPGEAGWRFLTLPPEISDDVRARTDGSRAAFGSTRVAVRVGETAWSTSLFFDRSRDCFLLPVKAEVRRREGCAEGDLVEVELSLQER
jgi:hypothetical protein